MKIYDWNKISESRKEKINKLAPIFIVASRDISKERIIQLTDGLGKQSTLIWGALKDEFIPGFGESPQFRSLTSKKLKKNQRDDVLEYYQRDINYIFQELKFKLVIFINGSWHKMLHVRQEFWTLERSRTPHKFLSPFVDEGEAKSYLASIQLQVSKQGDYDKSKQYSDSELMILAKKVASRSFATSWQTGAVLAKKGRVLSISHNTVVPYETYALHHGSQKEKHFSPPNDQNHYDTNHAEIEMLLSAQREKFSLKDTTLYIDLLPCPACARALVRTDISEIVYSHDHSEGYGHKLLEAAGKKLRRLLI